MTDFAAQYESPMVQLEATHLAFNHASVAPQQLSLRSPAFNGAKALGSPAAPPRTNRAGLMADMFGGTCLFERVLVVPQTVALGAVLTERTITVDIWNTYRNIDKSLSAVVITGPGSAQVTTPTLPLVFVPLGFLAQDVIYGTVGDPIIAQSIDFVFPGQDGTTLVVTGNRLAVFTIEPNWEPDGITEHPQIWMTDVLKAHSDSEQRVQLRTLPRSRVKFRVTPDRLTKSLLEALLWGWQNQMYGVPFWPDAHPLLDTASPGDTVLLVDTTDRGFVAGGLMMLWRDAFTYEVINIVALVTGGVQVVASGIANGYSADGNTLCVPVRRGRLADAQDVTRTTSQVAELELTFECEVV
jgi:hypothetical protein